MAQMEKGKQLEAWKLQPIGGEIYPPLQKTIWQKNVPDKAQNYLDCVKESHCSWLINNAVFSSKLTKEQKSKAIKGAKALGYEFFCSAWKLDGGKLSVKIENLGVAPFYYKWPVEVIDLETNKTLKTDWDIRKILPGSPQVFSIKTRAKRIAIRIRNLIENGTPVHFANESNTNGLLILK